MGWQDRDYAKEPQYGPVRVMTRGSGGLRPRSMTSTLIAINVAIYVLCVFTAGPGRTVAFSPLFLWGAMETSLVTGGQAWRLVTSDYLHWNTWHILLNMIALHFLGRPLEQVWGSRKFFVVYTIAGILGSLFYMVLTLTGWFSPGVAAGASGCVLGLLGAAAVLFPHAEVYIYFLFPVKIRVVAVVFAGLYIFNIWQKGDNAGGDACHLAGLAFGVWFALHGDRWWSYRGNRLLGRFGSGNAHRDRLSRTDFRARIEQRRTDAATVDRILDKVRRDGVGSLTEQERRALTQATERQRGFEQ